MYNDYPWDPKIVAVVERCVVVQRSFMYSNFQMGPQNGGRYRQVVVSSGLTVSVWQAKKIE